MYSTQLLSTLWNWSQQLFKHYCSRNYLHNYWLVPTNFIEWLVVGIYWFYSLSIMYWYPIAASGYLHKKMVSYSSKTVMEISIIACEHCIF